MKRLLEIQRKTMYTTTFLAGAGLILLILLTCAVYDLTGGPTNPDKKTLPTNWHPLKFVLAFSALSAMLGAMLWSSNPEKAESSYPIFICLFGLIFVVGFILSFDKTKN